MSALGQKRTFAVQKGMSALPSKADMCTATRDVRFGPKADMMAPLHDDWLDWKVLQAKERQTCPTSEILHSIYIRCGAISRTSFSRATSSRRAKPMWIMVVYVLIVVVSEVIVVAIGLTLDRIYPTLSLPVSLSLFFAVLWFAWILAVRLTEPKRAKRAKRAT
jgi:hypothetical protein